MQWQCPLVSNHAGRQRCKGEDAGSGAAWRARVERIVRRWQWALLIWPVLYNGYAKCCQRTLTGGTELAAIPVSSINRNGTMLWQAQRMERAQLGSTAV